MCGVERVTQLITRCSILEALYIKPKLEENSQMLLQNALVKLYTVVLNYLSRAGKYYGDSTLRK